MTPDHDPELRRAESLDEELLEAETVDVETYLTDARRIERILRNLLVNAVEHSEGRPIDILLAGDDDAVAVAVRDHGVGFEASQAKQVFLRFWRADPARARTVGGTGLGLSVVREIVEKHGGTIAVHSTPGAGARFKVLFPAATAAAA